MTFLNDLNRECTYSSSLSVNSEQRGYNGMDAPRFSCSIYKYIESGSIVLME